SPNTERSSACTSPCYGPGRTGGSAKRRSAGGRESPVRRPSAASAVHPAASGLLARHEPVPLARHAAVAPRDGSRLPPRAVSPPPPAASGLLARHEPVPLARHAAVAPRDGCRLARRDAALALPARPAAVEPLVPERAVRAPHERVQPTWSPRRHPGATRQRPPEALPSQPGHADAPLVACRGNQTRDKRI